MAVELPDLDLSVSFVVDDGEATGPLPLREIAESIAAGDRPNDSYVWWSGVSEWMLFSSDDQLMGLLTQPPSVEGLDSSVPPLEVEEVVEESGVSLDEPDRAGEAEPEEVDVAVATVEETVDLTEAGHTEPTDPLEEISLTESSVLADVGARLEALASATRHVQSSSKLDQAASAPALRLVSDQGDVDLREQPDGRSTGGMDVSDVRASTLATSFESMVRLTENHGRLLEQGARVRELLARACGAALSRQGYSVDRRNESAGRYFLGFEGGVENKQMSLEISPAASVSDETGHHVHLVLSWGRTAADMDAALQVVQEQLPVADRPLGTISSDAHIDTSLVSTRVELIWAIDDYIDSEYTIDRGRLEIALDAIEQSLERRWYDLFTPAD